MAYLRGNTYIWEDELGTVHVWGRRDAGTIQGEWKCRDGTPSAAIAIPHAEWERLCFALIQERMPRWSAAKINALIKVTR